MDPSGYNDITVEEVDLPPEIWWWLSLYGNGEYFDTIYLLTDQNGNMEGVTGMRDSFGAGSHGVIPDVVWDKANQMRKDADDFSLNITGEFNENTYNRQEYFEWGSDSPFYVAEFYLNEVHGNKKWELINATDYDIYSWEDFLPDLLGGLLMVGGFALTYLGCGMIYAGVVPPVQLGIAGLGTLFSYLGFELFWFGYNTASDDNVRFYNPFEVMLVP